MAKTVIHAACPHDCPDACGVLITIENNRAIRIQGDPAHPVTRGFLCAKVAKYVSRVYSPDRIFYPMKRIAPKGSPGLAFHEAFTRITWDEALATIADDFRSISAEFGPEAILPYSYGGTLGAIHGSTMDHRFFHRLGASQLDRTICSSTGTEALLSVNGSKLGTEPEQFRHSRYIIAWGANIHGNSVHLWPFLEEARRNGAKLVVIDPYKTRTARCADWYLPINPGTDVALALGMMNVIIGEGLYDAEYLAQHTIGFEELRKRAKEYTPERVADWTGISADDIRQLAREYATTRPAVIRVNYGVQRAENGGMAVRAITMLPCVTGSWKEVGGGLQLSTSGGFPLDREALKRPDLMKASPLGRAARVVNMSELGKALTQLDKPPVKAMFVFNSNPAAVCPDHATVIRGLKREDLFTVVHEQFLTDTCDYADIVLPATTFFEQKDLVPAYGHYFLQISQQAVAPLGESRSNADLFRALAERMGFTEACFRDSDDDLIDAALGGGHKWLAGITRERLEREGHVRVKVAEGTTPFLPYANGGFGTASGKAELYSATLAAQGLDPVVSFVPPTESRHSENARELPLEFLARKADNFLNSTFCNLPSHQPLEAGHMDILEMNEADAEPRQIVDGDMIRIFNGRGELRLRARVNGSVPPGVVSARLNWAKLSPDGVNVNLLTSARLADMGGGPTFYSALVEVERAKPR